jgi:hypothetical protein
VRRFIAQENIVGLAFLLIVCVSCGGAPVAPSSPIVGDWAGTAAFPRASALDFLYVHLTEQNQSIEGTACFLEEGSHLAFSNARVLGIYPSVAVDAPAPYGAFFAGTLQADGSIAGRTNPVTGVSEPMTLIPNGSGFPAACLTP